MSQIIALNSVVQFRICSVETNDGQISLNILNYFCTAVAGTGGTDLQAATKMDTNVQAAYKNWMPSTCMYRGVGCRIIAPTKYVEQTVVANAGVGGAGAQVLPTQVSGLIALLTAQAGRAYRGRIYVGFPAASWTNNDGEMTAAAQTALAAINTAIAYTIVVGTAPNTSTLQLGIYHKKLNTITYVNNSITRGSWATQRRRGDLGRKNAVPF